MLNYRNQAGFNLIELMTGLFVAGILLSVGIPSYTGFVANNRMATAANDIATSLHLARTEAIKQRASVSICPSSQWDAANPVCTPTDFSDGWIVFTDAVAPAAPDLVPNGAQSILYTHGPIDDGITITVSDADSVIAGDTFMIFGPNGVPVPRFAGNDATFNFQMCDKRGDIDTGAGVAAGRWITVSPTGRPQIYRNRAQVEAGGNPAAGC